VEVSRLANGSALQEPGREVTQAMANKGASSGKPASPKPAPRPPPTTDKKPGEK